MPCIFDENKDAKGKKLAYFQFPHLPDGVTGMRECELKLYLALLAKANRNNVVDVVASNDEIRTLCGLHPGSVERGRKGLEFKRLIQATKHKTRGFTYSLLNWETGKPLVDYHASGNGDGPDDFVFDVAKLTPEQYEAYFRHHLTGQVKNSNYRNKPGLTACCPFHKDSSPSFSVSLSVGRWNCHGACDTHGYVFDFEQQIAKLDGKEIDRGEARKRVIEILRSSGQFASTAKPAPDEIYQYTDLDGELLFEVCRYGYGKGKKLPARRLNPLREGEYIYNVNDVKHVLYRLPDVRDASSVLVVEGERKADTLRNLTMCDQFGLSIVATTNPFGAGKWKDFHSECLADKEVVILPDLDKKGLEHAEQVQESLKRVAFVNARIVRLPEEEGVNDVCDFLELKKHSREELVQVIGPDWFDSVHPFGDESVRL
jgi:5S rRNA maturation endonuclease (ribonuclease M5)